MPQRPWFGPKRFGWGLAPISWQGWALTVAYVASVVIMGLTIAAHQLWVFGTLFAVATVLFLLVAYLTSTGR